jgi:hypothetical protein
MLAPQLALAGAVAVTSEAGAVEASDRPPHAASAAESAVLWSSRSALTLPAGRWEIALLGQTRYGLAEGVELSLQPFLFFVLPHAELKARLLERGAFSLALRPRVSYPSPFLSLVAREGAGGLLPSTTDVPFAVQLEADVIASFRVTPAHVASANLGLAVAPHASSGELPLLDFPFLYPRFAALYTGAVPRLALGVEGHVFAGCFYSVDMTAYLLLLDGVDGAYAIEPSGELEYRFGARVALDLGLRASIARYPVGERIHYLPYADVKVGF